MYIIYVSNEGSLHEHAALGPALPHGRGLVHLLSPTRQRRQRELRDPLQASSGTAAFQLRLQRLPHRRHRGDVEHVPNAVLGHLGGALHVGHGPDLASYRGALHRGGKHRGGRLAEHTSPKLRFSETRLADRHIFTFVFSPESFSDVL